MDADSPTDVRLTDTQRRVLVALCRPLKGGGEVAAPATDAEIAADVFLSVDAVSGHLRALYRKFGIEDLPAGRRRARLVELASAGGFVEAVGPVKDVEPLEDADNVEPPPPTDPPAAPPADEDAERSITPYVTIGILIVVVIAATLSISGIFNQGSTTPPPPSPAAYRAEVTDECKAAVDDAPEIAGRDRAELAADYLGVIASMRSGFEALVTPAVPDVALERFGNGLRAAATFNGDVVSEPPAAGSKAEAEDVAGLTRAAAQIKAGATGYRLGHECVALGDLVARSAQNAAAS
jgi:hypothetical protein